MLVYPHASLFAGYREWFNSTTASSLTGLYSVVSLGVLGVDLVQVAVFGDADVPAASQSGVVNETLGCSIHDAGE